MKILANLYKLFRPLDASKHLVFPIIPFIFASRLSLSMVLIVIIVFLASLFNFGLNNAFDVDTDSRNKVKKNKNPFISKEIKKYQLYLALFLVLFIDIIASFFLFGGVTIYLILALIFWTCYSTPPFRFKGKFVFDMLFHGLGAIFFMLYSFFASSFNLSYLLPSIIVCFTLSTLVNLENEIGDYEADKNANLKTTAVTIGERISFFVYLTLFIILYLATIFILQEKLHIFLLILSFMAFLIQIINPVKKFLKTSEIPVSQLSRLYYPLYIFAGIVFILKFIQTIL
jgi:4-hydroxybenzoate polyprenyltransferase